MSDSENEFFPEARTKFKPIEKISKKDAKKQIEKLREAIHFHDYRYYVKNDPVISDSSYDILFNRLEELENSFPEFDSMDSPTHRVGAKLSRKIEKIEHQAPLLSLRSVQKDEDVENYIKTTNKNIESFEYVIEPKFDGFSVEVFYVKGEFRYGATRGDGRIGENISENLKTVREIPLKLRGEIEFPDEISIRGEVLISKKDFQRVNKKRIEENLKPFANARNAAAGVMRQLDPRKVAEIPFHVCFYDILKRSEGEFKTHWEELAALEKWGLKIYSKNKKTKDIKEIKKYHQEMMANRDTVDFDIDGIVIKVNSIDEQKKLGVRDRNPRWALAWKFLPKKEVTTLEDIVVQVGAFGKLTPVGLLDPVDVGGVTISRATLHNEDQVKKLDVRCKDLVRIARAGDVIPQIVERINEKGKKRGEAFKMPKKCPICESRIIRRGADYFCPAGLSCKAQLKGHIERWSSQEGMNIDLLGGKTIGRLVEEGMVESVADLYKLKEEDIRKLEGFAELSSKKLIASIRKNKNPPMDRFIYALGIHLVGRHAGRILAGKFEKMSRLIQADRKELEDIEEIGPEISESVFDFFQDKKNLATLDELKEKGVWPKEKKQKIKASLAGKTFVVTGALESYSRDEVEQLIENHGGRATSSVSGKTDYLVVGENPGSKYDEAKKNKVKIITEEELNGILSE